MGWLAGGVVGSYALLSSSPSLIWLKLGFGLARAVTIEKKYSIACHCLPVHIHHYVKEDNQVCYQHNYDRKVKP